ncbi:MAG: hypothetical protein ABI041_04335 [Bdellovibrionia bacterium]
MSSQHLSQSITEADEASFAGHKPARANQNIDLRKELLGKAFPVRY